MPALGMKGKTGEEHILVILKGKPINNYMNEKVLSRAVNCMVNGGTFKNNQFTLLTNLC